MSNISLRCLLSIFSIVYFFHSFPKYFFEIIILRFSLFNFLEFVVFQFTYGDLGSTIKYPQPNFGVKKCSFLISGFLNTERKIDMNIVYIIIYLRYI